MRRLLLSTTIALGGLSAAAGAQTTETYTDSAFCTAEAALRGGSWTQAGEDAGVPPEQEFAAMDTDGDGMVSQAEYIDCRNAAAGETSAESDRSEANLADADADGDGVISQEEYMAAALQAHNAVVTAEARGPFVVFRRYIFLPANAPEETGRDMSEQEARARSELNFASLDTDDSGDLSRAEWAERSTTIQDRGEIFLADFGEIDADRSGDLSPEEFREAGGRVPEDTEGDA
jgi:EF hand/EF-hand domain pair